MRYRVLVADPPWPQKGAGSLRGREGWLDAIGASKPMPYPTMTLEEIRVLSMADLVLPDAHLFLWTTNGFLEHSFGVARAWGFKPSTTLVWAKAPMGGGLGGAFGISTEFVLYARRGQPETRCRMPRTWFDWPRPYDERGKPKHSAKPPQLQDMVEMISPGPYLELFARNQRIGWDTAGNDCLNHVEMPS